MVISQPPGIILHIIIVLHQRCLNCSECFQRHLCSIHTITTSRVTHRNGAIKHILRIRSTEGSSADCSLFILSLHALALHLAVKILLQIFLYEDLSTLALHTSVSCVPSRMPAGPHFVTQPILLSENIPNIWHKSSTKHKEVRPDWNDKNDNANYIVSHGRFYQWLRLPFLKEIFDQVRKDLDCELFLFWTKTSQRLIIFTISHQIIFTSC